MAHLAYDPFTDYYGLLGVTPGAAPAEIRGAYRRLAKSYHPDLHAGSRVAEARMARLNGAKSVLLHPTTRAAYDAERAVRQAVNGARFPRGSAVYARPVPTPRWSGAQGSAPPSPQPAAARGWPEGSTIVLVAMVLLLGSAIALYVVDAAQVATRPVRDPPLSYGLGPTTRPTAENAARTAYLIAAPHPPDAQIARTANRVLQTLRDGSPEGEVLRALGRRLVRAADEGDRRAWDEAVRVLCAMSGQC